MLVVVQGDNGVVIPFTTEKNGAVDLTGSEVTVAIKRGDILLQKNVTVVDKSRGLCEFTLLDTDLTVSGDYEYQWTATFPDGRVLSGQKANFFVQEKISGIPSDDEGTDIIIVVDGGTF